MPHAPAPWSIPELTYYADMGIVVPADDSPDGRMVAAVNPLRADYAENRALILAAPSLLAFALSVAERACHGEDCEPDKPACDPCRAREVVEEARP